MHANDYQSYTNSRRERENEQPAKGNKSESVKWHGADAGSVGAVTNRIKS